MPGPVPWQHRRASHVCAPPHQQPPTPPPPPLCGCVHPQHVNVRSSAANTIRTPYHPHVLVGSFHVWCCVHYCVRRRSKYGAINGQNDIYEEEDDDYQEGVPLLWPPAPFVAPVDHFTLKITESKTWVAKQVFKLLLCTSLCVIRTQTLINTYDQVCCSRATFLCIHPCRVCLQHLQR